MNFKELYAEQKNVIWTVLILAVLVVGFLTIAPQVFHASSSVNGRNLPIYCVETDEKKVALSFDAAWGNEDTRRILEILKKHNTHVTFFMTGGWVESYPEDVKAILAAGHDLGNHSENHNQHRRRRQLKLRSKRIFLRCSGRLACLGYPAFSGVWRQKRKAYCFGFQANTRPFGKVSACAESKA